MCIVVLKTGLSQSSEIDEPPILVEHTLKRDLIWTPAGVDGAPFATQSTNWTQSEERRGRKLTYGDGVQSGGLFSAKGGAWDRACKRLRGPGHAP